jgi:hypothetical protein
MDDISQFDIVEAIQNALAAREAELAEYKTVTELCDETGEQRHKIIEGLKELKRQGRLDTGRKNIENIAGIVTPVPAYKLSE